MAVRTATKSGNLSDSTVWGATFVNGDSIIANGFDINIDVSATFGTGAPMRPSGTGFSAAATGTGGSLATGTWYVGYTDVNANGESVMSPIVAVALTSGQTISVTLPALPTGVVSRSIYTSVGLANPSNNQRQATGITATGAGAYIQSANPSAGQSERVLGAIVISIGSSVTRSAGVTVTQRGDINTVNAFFSFTAADRLIFTGAGTFNWDASTAVAPATTVYRVVGDCWMYLNGSVGNRSTFGSIATSSAAPGMFEVTRLHGGYSDWTRIGTGSTASTAAVLTANHAIMNVTFDTCGDIVGSGTVVNTADLSEVNCTWKNSLGSYNTVASPVNAPSTGLRSLAGSVYDKTPNITGFAGFNLDDTIFQNLYIADNPGDSGKWASAQRTVFGNATRTVDTCVVAGDMVDPLVVPSANATLDGGVGNPHSLAGSSGGASCTIDGPVYEYGGTGATGQMFGSQYTGSRTTTIKNGVGLQNGAGLTSGALANLGGAGNKVVSQHNTWRVGGAGAAGAGFVFGEVAQGQTGEIPTNEDCIFYDIIAGRNGYLDVLGHGSLVDTMTPAGSRNNCKFNLASYSNNTVNGVAGQTLVGVSAAVFTVAPGVGDVTVNPQFVDDLVGLARWDWTLASAVSLAVTLASSGANLARATRTSHGLKIGDWVTIGGATTAAYNVTARITAATTNTFDYPVVGTLGADSGNITKQGTFDNALAQMSKRNLAGFDSRYTPALFTTFVRAGKRPQSSVVGTGAHDGSYMGAVAYSPTASTYLQFDTQPVGSSVGSLLSVQPKVTVRNVSDNTIDTTSTRLVTLTIETLTGGPGTLTGTVAMNCAAGVAQFTNVGVTGTAGTFDLVAT
jgi:hypothetical protein